MKHNTTVALSPFARDVDLGLSAPEKQLSSRYFYDETGDRLFQEIMKLPEYYLTRAEYEIFETQKEEILREVDLSQFNLVELGSGDGTKTSVLLQYFMSRAKLEYFPIDISGNSLKLLEQKLRSELPGIRISPLNLEYFEALERIKDLNKLPKLLLFLGSNIGNFNRAQADSFFSRLNSVMNEGDQLLCGIDLKKDPDTILKAYNDSKGVTRDFNLNLLNRINRELGGNFDTSNFRHYPIYDPESGECRSYLISLKKHTVYIDASQKHYSFDKFEAIHTETSRKYSLVEIESLAHQNGFKVKKNFIDGKAYFTDSLWVKA